MKVDLTPAQPQRTSTSRPFTQLLRKAKAATSTTSARRAPPAAPRAAPPPKRPAAGVTPAGTMRPTMSAAVTIATTQAATAQRQQARARVDSEAARLTAVRADHHEGSAQQQVRGQQANGDQAQRVDRRVLGLILQELEAAFDRDPPRVERAANTEGKPVPFRSEAPPSLPPPPPAAPPARAEQAMALIERIETFVRSSRPALAVTLNNSLGARVEIERLGPGRIAIKLVGQRGPPSADTVSRIREELRARGLSVAALSVA